MGLEWIDDATAVFVFDSRAAARTAWLSFRKFTSEDADHEGFVMAKSIPIEFWPPEERINKSLGKGEGLKGPMKMRWARVDDVKQKGAMKKSEFYKKHGVTAGKEIYPGRGDGKRRRLSSEEDDMQQKARLDDELDAFLTGDSVDEAPMDPPLPPSKMRSDYISQNGKTLLERTSSMRAHPRFESRIISPLPRRALRSERNNMVDHDGGNGFEWNDGHHRRNERPRKSQKELDDELEAFLNDRD